MSYFNKIQTPVPYGQSWNLTSISDITTRPDGGPPCPSPYVLHEQSEDCLYLNVYTKDTHSRLPVVTFIHPGGFYILSGRPVDFGPDYLLDEDIVLVTFNYRLGFLGFASRLGDGDAASSLANAGLKDQALVLRWINQNIHLFGGDPDNVTIMGSSAGAMSVGLHLVSPMSAGLFHRAIIMSGGILPQKKLPREQNGLLIRQAQLLDGLANQPWTDESAYECVRSASAHDLAKSVYKMFEFGRDNPVFLWLPVVENDGHNGTSFLGVDDPLAEISAGRWATVPLLTGTTMHEFSASAHELLANDTQRSLWTEDFGRWAPVALHFERGSNASLDLCEHIWEYYFQSRSSTAGVNFNRLQRVN